MKQVEARRWISVKETFNQYAVEKLAIMSRLNISETDKINLLIGGVFQTSIRASALSLGPMPINQFLDRMRYVTEGVLQLEKRLLDKNRDNSQKDKCKNCGKIGHTHIHCRDPVVTCFYCKKKDHRKDECSYLQNINPQRFVPNDDKYNTKYSSAGRLSSIGGKGFDYKKF
ncbi:uncharacterized protein LOC116850606 [Odontomachus brunneus]|uniref:uncharacterized protein LOC116850606 n=1 Tax=Odontomachus brunneus TaxID=486640 RepID=UPI0013F24C3C|nr:uncharacterized protein LOC116850606 [Odontomachus brunneus]